MKSILVLLMFLSAMDPSRVVSGFVPGTDPTNAVLGAIQNMQTEMNKKQRTTMDLLNDIQSGFQGMLLAKNKEDAPPKVTLVSHVVESATVAQQKYPSRQEEARCKIVNPRNTQISYSSEDSIVLQKMQPQPQRRQPRQQQQQPRRPTPQPHLQTIEHQLPHQHPALEEAQRMLVEPIQQPPREAPDGKVVNKEQLHADFVGDSVVLQLHRAQQSQPTIEEQQSQSTTQPEPLIHPPQHRPRHEHPVRQEVDGTMANKKQMQAGHFDDSMVRHMPTTPPMPQKQPMSEVKKCLSQLSQRNHPPAPKEVKLVALLPDPPFQDYCPAKPQPRQQLTSKPTSSSHEKIRVIALPPDQPLMNSGQQEFNRQQQHKQQRYNQQPSRINAPLIGLQPDQPFASSSRQQQQQWMQQQALHQGASANNLVVGLQPDQPFDQPQPQNPAIPQGHHPSVIYFTPPDQLL